MQNELFETDPLWDLSALYTSVDSPEITADFDRARSKAAEFQSSYQGKISNILSEPCGVHTLGNAIVDYEAILELTYTPSTFADLVHSTLVGDVQIDRFYGEVKDQVSDIVSKLLFFPLELCEIPEEELKLAYADAAVFKYKPWIEAGRARKPYLLSTDLERLLHEKTVTGREAWSRLFDQTMEALRFDVGNRSLNSTEVQVLMRDGNPKVRSDAAQAMTNAFRENIQTFSLITNTLAKDEAIETDWRGQPDMATKRHLNNQVESKVVETLTDAVKGRYESIAHRYYALKADWLGVQKLNSWDRVAPLPGVDPSVIPWSEAKEIVLAAFRSFDPRMSEIAQLFFDKNWIDAPSRKGKTGGAYSHPTVPSAHPFVMVNYNGHHKDVSTLAHELGHGVHQYLASEQGFLNASTPLTLAETASVFGEMLTFQSLLEGARSEGEKRLYMASKVEDMINTVVRQISFYDFERRVHGARREGELSSKQIGEIWVETQSESLGPAVKMNEGFETYWCYIPHFLHSPFYVYAYAFGECLVNSLYAVYCKEPLGFQDKYFDMLRAGGTLHHKELLAPFGLDASRADFWNEGLDLIGGFIDQLEAMGS
jgi:oligoendopeptidase F